MASDSASILECRPSNGGHRSLATLVLLAIAHLAWLGAAPKGSDPESLPLNHSPYAEFDDAVLADGAALYAELATRRLAA